MGEWWGPTPLWATAKIRQIFTLDDWWNLSLSPGANPRCIFTPSPAFPSPLLSLSPAAHTHAVCGGFSFGTCKPVVMCTFHSDSDSFKQRLKKKNHPLLHALCTNAHRVHWPVCMGNFRRCQWFLLGWMCVTSLSEWWIWKGKKTWRAWFSWIFNFKLKCWLLSISAG